MKVRIRRDPRLKGPRYEADCGIVNGKRLAPWFKKRQDADDFIRAHKDKLKRHGTSALEFTEELRQRYTAAEERLRRIGATIEQAVDYFETTHKPLRLDEKTGKSITVGKLLTVCLLEKQLAGLEERSVKQLKSSCLSFVRGKEETPACNVTRDAVKAWILGNGFAPKTQRTYLGDLRTLFAFGVSERYIRSNPIAGEDGWIELEPDHDREIAVFDVASCARLLNAALFADYLTLDRKTGIFRREKLFRRLLGYIAIALFCGVRPEKEAGKTTVAELDLHGRTLVITGGRAKTGRRRVVELPAVAVTWLRLWRRLCPHEKNFVPKNFRRLWDSLRKAAGLYETWPHDVQRHTAATYHYATHQNAALLKAQLGHVEEEDTLHRHYRAVKTLRGKPVSKAVAAQFWKLTPRRARLLYGA